MTNVLKNLANNTQRLLSSITYSPRLRRHKRSLPTLFEKDKEILHGLVHEGVFITSLKELNVPSTQQFLKDAKCLLDQINIHTDSLDKKSYAAHATEKQLMSFSSIILWGLEERFLSIVENYIGLSISYRGLTFRRDMANGRNVETRLWHRDNEDHRITKIIVYLNDVFAEGGPFEYIPKYHTPPIHQLKFTHGRVLDEDMKKMVPESQWISCQGKAGTVVFADPCNIFHRGKIPVAQDRFALFFCYNSRFPLKPQYCESLFLKSEFLDKYPNLSERQKQSIAE